MTSDQAHRVAELAQERVRLLERLTEIDKELANEMASSNTPAPAARPTAKGIGRIVGVGKGHEADGKQPDLPTLLAQIAAKTKPLKLADFVALSREAGYVTEARDFPNMVYHALLKLVRQGVLKKDQASRVYNFVGEAAYP